jgi:LysM repeat protein
MIDTPSEIALKPLKYGILRLYQWGGRAFPLRLIIPSMQDPDSFLVIASQVNILYMRRSAAFRAAAIVVSLSIPLFTHAGVFSFVGGFLGSEEKAQELVLSEENSQTMALLSPALHPDPNPAKGGGDISVVDGAALLPEAGPSGTLADIEEISLTSDHISLYVVRPGDSLSQIAEMFHVSPSTIKWANDISSSDVIVPGDTLVILPISGIRYTVKSGDTVGGIAKKYGGDVDEILEYNALESASLAVGDILIIPDGEMSAPVSSPSSYAAKPAATTALSSGSTYAGYYMRPVSGGYRSQGLHGYNAIDIAVSVGTPIYAMATGDVILARSGGWNGGYGSYIVIKHLNGTQTLYAHASSVIVSAGQHVVQGQVIGYTGNTGKSTGPHIHFEIRGGLVNPF